MILNTQIDHEPETRNYLYLLDTRKHYELTLRSTSRSGTIQPNPTVAELSRIREPICLNLNSLAPWEEGQGEGINSHSQIPAAGRNGGVFLMAVFPQIERFFWFHDQVKAGRFPNAARLADQFEISHKTAQRDITRLRDLKDARKIFENIHHLRLGVTASVTGRWYGQAKKKLLKKTL